MGITTTRRVSKLKRLGSVAIECENISFQEELRREWFQVVDQLRKKINKRLNRWIQLTKYRGFSNLILNCTRIHYKYQRELRCFVR